MLSLPFEDLTSHSQAEQLAVIRRTDSFSRAAAWMAGDPRAHTNGRLPGDRRSLRQAIAPPSPDAEAGAPDLRFSHHLSHLLDPQLADTSQSTAVSETEFVERAIEYALASMKEESEMLMLALEND